MLKQMKGDVVDQVNIVWNSTKRVAQLKSICSANDNVKIQNQYGTPVNKIVESY